MFVISCPAPTAHWHWCNKSQNAKPVLVKQGWYSPSQEHPHGLLSAEWHPDCCASLLWHQLWHLQHIICVTSLCYCCEYFPCDIQVSSICSPRSQSKHACNPNSSQRSSTRVNWAWARGLCRANGWPMLEEYLPCCPLGMSNITGTTPNHGEMPQGHYSNTLHFLVAPGTLGTFWLETTAWLKVTKWMNVKALLYLPCKFILSGEEHKHISI